MTHMRTILRTLVVVLGLWATVQAEPGFFYALDHPDGDDRLYRIDVDANWDATVTAIGPPGALGYPEVTGLIWDQGGRSPDGIRSSL